MDAETVQQMITSLNEVTSELMTFKPSLAVKSGDVATKLKDYLESLSKSQSKPQASK